MSANGAEVGIAGSQRRALTLDDLRARRHELLQIAQRHGADNLRIFGSVARGDARADSDVDFLVDVTASAAGFAYFGLLDDLRCALADALDREVDVVDSAALSRLRGHVLSEAVPL
jgi:predicted nucleotidyltransferase